MRLGAAQAREREAVSDLDALHRLDAHERRGEPGVEPVGLLGVRAEAGRRAVGDDLDDPAERVAVGAGGVGCLLPARLRVGAADLDDAPGDRRRRSRRAAPSRPRRRRRARPSVVRSRARARCARRRART